MDYQQMTVSELKKLASIYKIKNRSKMNKDELVNAMPAQTEFVAGEGHKAQKLIQQKVDDYIDYKVEEAVSREIVKYDDKLLQKKITKYFVIIRESSNHETSKYVDNYQQRDIRDYLR